MIVSEPADQNGLTWEASLYEHSASAGMESGGEKAYDERGAFMARRLSAQSWLQRVDLATLRLFVATCETGSIAGGGEREHVAASAVSKRITDLEHLCDTALLDRGARGVVPTPAGETLLHHARAVMVDLARLRMDMGEYARGVRGVIRMVANLSAIMQFLPEDLGSFLAQHAHIRVDLQERTSADVKREVIAGRADLGVCSGIVAPDQELQVRPYREDKLVLVVPAGHALARRPMVAFAEALSYDQIGLPSGSAVHAALEAASAEAGLPYRLRMRVEGLETMCRMIQNGLGVGVMPDKAFGFLSSMGLLVAIPLSDIWAVRPIVVVARDFARLSPAARLLVDHLHKGGPAGQGEVQPGKR